MNFDPQPEELELPLKRGDFKLHITMHYCYSSPVFAEEGVPCVCVFKDVEGKYSFGVGITTRNVFTGQLEWETFNECKQAPWAFFDIPSEIFLDKDFLVALREKLNVSLQGII